VVCHHRLLLRNWNLFNLEENFVVVATNYCFLKQLLQRIMVDFSSGVEIGQYVYFLMVFRFVNLFVGMCQFC